MEKITVEGNTLAKMQACYLNKRAKGFKKASNIKIKRRQIFKDGEIKTLCIVDMVREDKCLN